VPALPCEAPTPLFVVFHCLDTRVTPKECAHTQASSVTVSPVALEPLMDVAELADYLGIRVSTVYDWRV
jgi:hypothetical protein